MAWLGCREMNVISYNLDVGNEKHLKSGGNWCYKETVKKKELQYSKGEDTKTLYFCPSLNWACVLSWRLIDKNKLGWYAARYLDITGLFVPMIEVILKWKLPVNLVQSVHVVSLLFSMGGVILMCFSSMDNPDGKGITGNRGNSECPSLLLIMILKGYTCITLSPDSVASIYTLKHSFQI